MRGLKILLSFLQHAKTNVEKVKAAVKKNLKNSKKERIKDNIKVKKEDIDVQLTGCPVTRTRQLNLDQLIPTVGVHLCLQLEDWLRKPLTNKQKFSRY